MTPHSSSARRYLKIKRISDVLGAAAGLFFTAPLMFLIAVALRLSVGKPVLFRQRRPGWNERPFVCLKFRTMTDDRNSSGQLLPDEQRLTWFGALLRRTSLDELPQLWNVLRGEASLVGPRPLLERYLPYYTEAERRRHSVRPGLTGWAQIHRRGCLPFDERLAMDVWYVDHMSWRLDLRIVLATIWIVLTQHGAVPDINGPLLPFDVQRENALTAVANSSGIER